ncbi:putative enoyl-CoA hydratase [Microbacterium dextranolyticum]|uniref:3-hydroxyisobutyryl-CoA hydrolase n=1 Tax=Microbacterium dextranolyticum TaxID=36806 RepID=A0A9W6HJL7_9MICO|nr:putative enoyl-CoA hydratase [Microbacterium dextranolyticum]
MVRSSAMAFPPSFRTRARSPVSRAGNVGRVSPSDIAAEPVVLVRTVHRLGRLTLNRPHAINALDLPMISLLSEALDAWEHDDDVVCVLLDGAGERGLCAGGDVRALREHILSGRDGDVVAFFRAEYALNARIAEYPKPIVVLADGVTMGGGIGLAGHAAIRVVTERSRLAMPETRIGLTPDVGGSWLLARAPGRIGEYLALTGSTMDAADAVYAGFADHIVGVDRLDALRDALSSPEGVRDPAALVRSMRVHPGEISIEASALARARGWIADAFAAETAAAIVARLRARPEPEASAVADTLEELSPTSLEVTLAAVRAARGLPDLRAALAQEYGLVLWLARTQPDLVEGIRAQLVDKDRSPRWQPPTLAEVESGIGARALAWTPPEALWRRGGTR